MIKIGLVRTNRGFGLLQALVSVAILGIAITGLMTALNNSYKHEMNLNTLLEGRELLGELTELIKSTNCGIRELESPLAVPGGLWVNNEVLPLTRGVSGRFLELNSGDNYGRFTVEKISIAPYYDRKSREEKYIAAEGDGPADFSNSRVVRASLRIDLTTKNVKGAPPKAPIRAPIFLYLDSDKTNIIGCLPHLENTDLAAICGAFGGSWSEADSKCNLPCPPGLLDQNGVCVSKSPDAENEETFCNVNQKCDVADKYIL